MVVRSNGDFVNARQAPTLLQVQIAIQGQELVVNGPAMPTLTLPLAYCVDRKNVMKCRYSHIPMYSLLLFTTSSQCSTEYNSKS